MDAAPLQTELVLIGGGHTHAIALRQWGMQPVPGVRLTLLSETTDTPYSGMLPGHVAGFYSHDDCHIDLRRLAQFAGAQFYRDRAIGLDLAKNQVLCVHHPPVRFDVLSIDIGSTPKLPDIPGVADWVIPAKPVRDFLHRWRELQAQVAQNPAQVWRIAIVGGGAGGVELAFTMQTRLHQILQAHQQPPAHLELHLVHRGAELLSGHGAWVRHHLQQRLRERGIHLHLGENVVGVKPGELQCESGWRLACEAIVWVTQAAAPSWLGESGLAVDDRGFVQVDDTLRSPSHPHVFAAGDIATMIHHPRPKAGVFAVRQGKPLWHNLRQVVQGQEPRPFRPQKHYLSLIGTGDGRAVATWAGLGWAASWLWRWKDQIDRAFMQQFAELPVMSPTPSPIAPAAQPPEPPPMRCAGCGAKVGSPVLQRVLSRLAIAAPSTSPLPLIGLASPDDAAVLAWPPDRVLVQTLDYLPALVSDPFEFGQIAAHHALSDVLAMGAAPHSALAIATLPYARPALVEETLYQLLSGAVQVLTAAGATLIGGHTIEGPTLALGLACNGLAERDRLLRKGGMQPQQALILTKPLGVGALFAAHMRLRAKGVWLDGAIATMQQSNQAAVRCLLAQGATSATDVTGFGLIGHLQELVHASGIGVILELEAIPVLAGAVTVSKAGITSSLYPQNAQASATVEVPAALTTDPRYPLLFDPQTAGGLLATVPEAAADRAIAALHAAGYPDACIIGTTQAPNLNPTIQVR